jgi:uncharacterized protein (DUF697 family)
VQAWTDSCFGFELVQARGFFLVVVVLVVGLERVLVVSLLGVLLLVLNTGIGGVIALSWRGRMFHGLSCVDLVLLQA